MTDNNDASTDSKNTNTKTKIDDSDDEEKRFTNYVFGIFMLFVHF